MISTDKNNKRTLSTYAVTLKVKSKSTQKLFQSALNNIRIFGKINLEIIEQYNDDNIYDILQEWILWNNNRGITAASISCYFNIFRSYLWYHKIKLDEMDIKQNLRFPQTLYEERVPITRNTIFEILSNSKSEFRFQLLALISSGMRVNELGQIQIIDLDLTHSNIMIRLPAKITKTGRSRVTFFSKQVSDMIRYRIKTNSSNSIFCGNRTQEQASNLILKRFATARKRAKLLEKYNHCMQNRYKIHVHSMRSYFITKANRIQFGLGHILAGHNFYMKEYNLYTIDELRTMYEKFENDLTFKNIQTNTSKNT